MWILKPVFLLVILFYVGNTGLLFAENDPPKLINPDTIPIAYCSDSVQIAPNISFENLQFNESSEGIKISIANYKKDEDVLIYRDVNVPGIIPVWNSYNGYLELKGIAPKEAYIEAVSNVYYKNIASTPTLGLRDISISLLDADYLPATEHFYRFVANDGISWPAAKAQADTTIYYGLQGYLATIRSKEEQDFILTKTKGTGWIGGSDAEQEGTWKWVCGPDAGTVFWQGNYNGSSVNSEYSHWGNQEPNNLGDENYAHIMYYVNKGFWNDLNGAGSDLHDYRPQGFLIEFGGMEDLKLNLSATAKIEVKKIAFTDDRDFETCAGDNQELNVAADPNYVYSWSPNQDISSITVSNPIVSPSQTITYQSIGEYKGCVDTAYFHVKVNPLPVSKFPADSVICEGSSIVLDPGEHLSYVWNSGETGRTITVGDAGVYSVKITNEWLCETNSEINIDYSQKPVFDSSKVSTLVCGSKSQQLEFDFLGRNVSTVLRSINPVHCRISDSESLTPTVSVTEFGEYKLELEMKDEESCTFFDTLTIGFHNQPKADFKLDEEECQGYNLKLQFTDTVLEDAVFTWYYNSDIYREEIGLNSVEIPLGFGELNRTVGLKVNEQGCIDSLFKAVIVTPNVSVKVDDSDGCTPHNALLEAVSSEPAQSYEWDFGDGATSVNDAETHIFTNNSDTIQHFDVHLTVVSTEGCKNTGIMKDLITVYNKPTVDLSFLENDCNELSSEISYVGSATDRDKYYWDLSDLEAGEIIQNPGTGSGPLEINRSSSPFLNLQIHVVSEYGCKSDTLSRIWKRKPVFRIQADTTEGCPPLSVSVQTTVFDSVDQVNFQYFTGDGNNGTGSFFSNEYLDPESTFQVSFEGISTVTGCLDTVFLDSPIKTYGVPKADFNPAPEEVLISDPVVDFQNSSSGATSYSWDFGDSVGTSTEIEPLYQYSEMGFYPVVLFAYNDLGCADSTVRKVTVTFDKLYPPNAFSPNSPLEEDREFRLYAEGVEIEEYRLLIFNRWGEEIFESVTPALGWDGRMKNQNFAPAGVYTWVLQYLDFTGRKHSQKGTVTLLF